MTDKERTKWTERKFNFESSVGTLTSILERLRGTSARMKVLTSGISDEVSIKKPDNKWSIKEHMGHLSDLEILHEGRIDDFIHRKEILRPADMTNAETNKANHNEEDMENLINGFAEKRTRFVSRLEKLDEPTHHFRSLHPRLQVQMLPVDFAYFVAEHDDHHLTSIREILERVK